MNRRTGSAIDESMEYQTVVDAMWRSSKEQTQTTRLQRENQKTEMTEVRVEESTNKNDIRNNHRKNYNE